MEKYRVTSNKRNRTFTIYKNGSKYRTYRFSVDEFRENEYNTNNDWNDFLRHTEFYEVIK